PVEREHEQLGPDAPNQGEDVAGKPLGGRRDDRDLVPERRLEPGPQRRPAVAGGPSRGEGGGKADRAGDVLGARAQAALLAATEHERWDPATVADDQAADALGAAQLVRRERQRLRARRAQPDRE